MLWAIFVGGSVAAEVAVRVVPRIGEAWGKGDEKRTLGLTRVFTLSMASYWLRSLDSQLKRSPEKRRAEREAAITTLLTAFDSYSERNVQQVLNMDLQFNVDESGPDMIYHALLLAQAVEACGGQPSGISWATLSFPMRDAVDVETSGLEISFDLLDIGVITHVLARGVQGMFDTYEAPETP